MATPGRTHISWDTQPAQIRELISYIDFLEAKVSYLQHHHERCNIWTANKPSLASANSPYLPPDAVDRDNDEDTDEASNASDGGGSDNQIPKATSSQTTPSYVRASLTTLQPSERRIESTPRWRRIVDQITKGWDKSNSWTEKREAIGLDSVQQNKYALTAILGLKEDLPLHLAHDGSRSLTSSEEYRIGDATNSLVMSARQYALDSKASQRNPGLVAQLHVFRELVFTSLCVVMEHQGLPIDTIDSLMRICISSSGSANLYRLRRGALWVNRVISGTMMKKMGWGHGSTEFFVLCRFSDFLIPFITLPQAKSTG